MPEPLTAGMQDSPLLGPAPLVIVYLVALITWAYTMLYVFIEIILASFTDLHKGMPQWICAWLCFFLLVLHHVYVLIRLIAWLSHIADLHGASKSASAIRD